MPWVKVSDQASKLPELLEVAEYPDAQPWLVTTVMGWLTMCAADSAAQLTDGVISMAVARSNLHGVPLELVTRAAEWAGLIEETTTKNGRPAWKIIEHDELIHIRSREAVEWDRQRDEDRRNPELTIVVRSRDGDVCRYCGMVVQWGISRAARAGTLDHREPGVGGTPETVVVACQGCNSKRRSDPNADENTPLLPAPADPYFSPSSRDWINAHPIAVEQGIKIPPRRGRPVKPGTVLEQESAGESQSNDGGINRVFEDEIPYLSESENTDLPAETSGLESDAVPHAVAEEPAELGHDSAECPENAPEVAERALDNSELNTQVRVHLVPNYPEIKYGFPVSENAELAAQTSPSRKNGVQVPGSRVGSGRVRPGQDRPARVGQGRRRRGSRGKRGKRASE